MTPEGWEHLSVEEALVATARIGWKGLSKSDFTTIGPYLITGMHFSNEGTVNWNECFRIPQWRYDESPEVIVRANDVLLTKDGTIGKVAYVTTMPGPAALNSHLYLLRPRDGSLTPRFLYYVLQSSSFRQFVGLNATGSTITGLPWKTFRKFTIEVPPLAEQRKIAAILSSVDDAIESTQAVIDQLSVVKKAMMAELLTRGLPGRHTEFKQTEIGEVPEDWEVVLTGDVLAKLHVGLRFEKRTVSEHGTIPVLDQSQTGLLGFHNDKAGIGASVLEPVVTFANHTCAVRWMDQPFSVIQNVFPLRGSRGVTTRFLYYLLQTRLTPSGYKGHWPELVESHSVVPSMDEQSAITGLLDSIEVRIASEVLVSRALSATKSALMSVLLSGELRVTPNGPAP